MFIGVVDDAYTSLRLEAMPLKGVVTWYACKLAKEKNVSVNIVDRSGGQLNDNNDPYYKCLKDEFSFAKIEYKNKEGKSFSKGGRVLMINGQASFESVIDIVFVSILMDS